MSVCLYECCRGFMFCSSRSNSTLLCLLWACKGWSHNGTKKAALGFTTQSSITDLQYRNAKMRFLLCEDTEALRSWERISRYIRAVQVREIVHFDP